MGVRSLYHVVLICVRLRHIGDTSSASAEELSDINMGHRLCMSEPSPTVSNLYHDEVYELQHADVVPTFKPLAFELHRAPLLIATKLLHWAQDFSAGANARPFGRGGWAANLNGIFGYSKLAKLLPAIAKQRLHV
eukprot:4347973-Amphidinium_carterae.1